MTMKKKEDDEEKGQKWEGGEVGREGRRKAREREEDVQLSRGMKRNDNNMFLGMTPTGPIQKTI